LKTSAFRRGNRHRNSILFLLIGLEVLTLGCLVGRVV
jgi:hypothetical protein